MIASQSMLEASVLVAAWSCLEINTGLLLKLVLHALAPSYRLKCNTAQLCMHDWTGRA